MDNGVFPIPSAPWHLTQFCLNNFLLSLLWAGGLYRSDLCELLPEAIGFIKTTAMDTIRTLIDLSGLPVLTKWILSDIDLDWTTKAHVSPR